MVIFLAFPGVILCGFEQFIISFLTAVVGAEIAGTEFCAPRLLSMMTSGSLAKLLIKYCKYT